MSTFGHIASLPSRGSFKCGCIDDSIRAHDPILFMPCDVCDNDVWSAGKAKYDLRIYGTLENGEKACVHIDQAPVYFEFDVSVSHPEWSMTSANIARDPAATQSVENDGITYMRALLRECNNARNVTQFSAVWRYPLHGFTLENHLYVRMYFATLRARSECIRALRDHVADSFAQYPNIIAHDDCGFGTPSYFNALAREYHFMTAGWNQITKWTSYKRVAIPDAPDTFIHEFAVELDNYVPAPAPQNDADVAKRMRDRTLIESWDIETYCAGDTGTIPDVGGDYIITTISLVYSYAWSEDPLVCFVLSIYDAHDDAHSSTPMRVHYIKCSSETEMLIARAKIAQRMAPDLRVAFNGSNFDWKLFSDKVLRAECCNEVLSCMDLSYQERKGSQVDAWNYKFTKVKVKISADSTHECPFVALMAGCLDLDLMPVMRKIYRNEEVKFAQSLNKYLEKAKLPPKNDIHYKTMLRIFQRAELLNARGTLRECHCKNMQACTFCASSRPSVCPVREIDCAPVSTAGPMQFWTYNDGHGGRELRMRDECLHKCCACGARVINARDIAMVNNYCAIDSVRPLQLIRKLSVMIDNRELANATYTSLFDAFMRADGMRVVNFIGSFARDFNIAISARAPTRPKSSFMGGRVFNPIYGRGTSADGKTVRPVTALDYSSLYPSLILTYNISPDMLVTNKENAELLQKMGYQLHYIEPFEYEEGGKRGTAGNVIKTMHGWSVRHNGVLAPHTQFGPRASAPITSHVDRDGNVIKGRPALEREHIGLFGASLNFLLESRAAIRREMGAITAQIKTRMAQIKGSDNFEVDIAGLDAQVNGFIVDCKLDPSIVAPLREQIAELELRWKCLNSKQLARKVLANTFYGQMGSSMSTCYTLLGAAGVTSAGRYNITRVAEMLKGMGYVIVYGDTDSLYTMAPEKIYAEVDALRKENKLTLEEYWGRMVTLARADMDKLRLVVSASLRENNGTRFLSMAYEEVGMPALFFGKKKYILRPHVQGVTFKARAMIRGLEIVKRGHTPLAKIMGDAIIADLLDIREDVDVKEIVRRRVEEYYTRPMDDISLFVQYKTYKPQKNNVMVNRFVERMRERYAEIARTRGAAAAEQYAPPEAGDKFPYIIADREVSISTDGHCVTYKIGDKMEYPCAVKDGLAKIDRKYYMNSALMTLFTRFVCSDKMCAPENDPDRTAVERYNPDKDFTAYDKYRQDRASQFLRDICRSFETANPAENKSLAQMQRCTAKVFCESLHQSARNIGVNIDARVARLLINDRLANFCRGEIGDVIPQDVSRCIVDIICESAREQTKETEMSFNEQLEAYACCLEQECTPEQLAERYSASYYNTVIIAPLKRASDLAKGNIASCVTQLITIYRAKHIAETLAKITRASYTSGTKGKLHIEPQVMRELTLDSFSLNSLAELSHYMNMYSMAHNDMLREAAMRARYATDRTR